MISSSSTDFRNLFQQSEFVPCHSISVRSASLFHFFLLHSNESVFFSVQHWQVQVLIIVITFNNNTINTNTINKGRSHVNKLSQPLDWLICIPKSRIIEADYHISLDKQRVILYRAQRG